MPEDQREHRDTVVDQVEQARRESREAAAGNPARHDAVDHHRAAPVARAGEGEERGDVGEVRRDPRHQRVLSRRPARAIELIKQRSEEWGVKYAKVSHYCFACLTVEQILKLADEARDLFEKHGRGGSVIYRIWEDTEIDVSLNKSLATVKADAAQRSFQAYGQGIVWAVLDSGIQGDHPHFAKRETPFGALDTLTLDGAAGPQRFHAGCRRGTGGRPWQRRRARC